MKSLNMSKYKTTWAWVAVVSAVLFVTDVCNSNRLISAAETAGAKLDEAIAQENYLEAEKQANAILHHGTPEDRAKTVKTYGRILLGLGQRDQARQYLATLSKPGNDPSGGQLVAIYGAWLAALDGNPDEGIATLEKILQKGDRNLTTAEAADVLAMLYMARDEKEKAKKVVDFGLQVLQYLQVKDGYLVALLHGRLTSNFTSGEAKRLYDTAEKLRIENKFAEAGPIFARVRAMYPKNLWGHASGFRMGQCHWAAGRPSQAIDGWRKFIKEAPAGPWRGQAYVALIDAVLSSELDLKKATEYTMAATAVLARNAGPAADGKVRVASATGTTTTGEKGTVSLRAVKRQPKAGQGRPSSSPEEVDTSWREAAYDIDLRQGIISQVDGRFDAAVQAYQQAQKVAGSVSSPPSLIPNPCFLDRLIEAAKQRMQLVPGELAVGDPRAAIGIALGTIYNTLHQYDLAKKYFRMPLSGPLRSRSPAHRSYAGLGLARILVVTGGSSPPSNASTMIAITPKKSGAKTTAASNSSPLLSAAIAYEASRKEYPNGSWHEETLRELALLTERIAIECTNPPAAKSPPDEPGKQKPTKPVISESARQQQRKAMLIARLKALPYWTDLRQCYPTSRHIPESLYHLGMLYTDAEKSEESLAAFDELVHKFPTSPWTGEAQIRLIDVKLERQLDLPGARKLAEAAIGWYEHLDQSKAAPVQRGLWEDVPDSPRSRKEIGYEIYIRAGLVEYLSQGDQGRETKDQTAANRQSEIPDPRLPTSADHSSSAAVVFFEKAKLLSPDRNMIVVQGSIPAGVERLTEAAKLGKSLTPEIVRAGDEKARLILMLADAYYAGEERRQSFDLCNRILAGAVPGATREQRSYAFFQCARNNYSFTGKEFNPQEAIRDYILAVRTAPKAEWASKAMFFAANILWNHYHKPDAAVAVWTRLIRDYPNSIEADSSTLFISVVYRWTNRPEDAKQVLKDFLAKHPRSPVAAGAREQLAMLAAPPDKDDKTAQPSNNAKGTEKQPTRQPHKMH